EIIVGKEYQIESKILNEKRKIKVYLPPSHQDSTLIESYPILYVLDGDWYFQMLTGIIEYSKGSFRMPEMIVVGISNNDRIKELTPSFASTDMFGNEIPGLENSGGGNAFIRFLKEELKPHIQTEYRAGEFEIIAGHSFGGLLVNHIFTREQDMFNAYILIDPSFWWNGREQIRQTESFLQANPQLKSLLYFGEADNAHTETTNNAPHIEAMDAYKLLIKNAPSENLSYQFDLFEGETHASVGIPSMYKALSFIFEGYRPADSVFQNPLWLSNHYAGLSSRLGVKMPPPESLVRNLAWGAQYGEKNLHKAIAFFELNLKNYPDSFFLHKILGEACEQNEQKEKAMTHFKKSLKLQADPVLQKKLEEMQAN
ncbi:MAG: alpha/beta hydrolase-fold protein, partial [Bacteroidota bacterium]